MIGKKMTLPPIYSLEYNIDMLKYISLLDKITYRRFKTFCDDPNTNEMTFDEIRTKFETHIQDEEKGYLRILLKSPVLNRTYREFYKEYNRTGLPWPVILQLFKTYKIEPIYNKIL